MDSFLIEKYTYIKKNIRFCFITAIICGIFAHIYALTNHLYNYDELYHTPTGFGTGIQMGRWGLSVLAGITRIIFDDVFTIPLFNGMVSIVMYSVVACIAVELFDITDNYYAAIVGALIATFPSVVCRMFYMYTTHFYAIGEMITTIGVLILFKFKNKAWSIIISISLLVFGVSVYQADFVTAVCLVVGVLFVQFIRDETDIRTGLRNSICGFLYLAISMVLYLISNKIALKITGLDMTDHSENYNTMGQLSLGQLVESVSRCYKNFLKLPLTDVYATNPNIIVKVTFLVSILCIVYVLIRVLFLSKKTGQKILLVLIAVVLPVVVNLVYIMAASSGIMYSIMVFDTVFLFVIAIGAINALTDVNGEDGKFNKLTKLLCNLYEPVNFIFAIALFGTVISYIWFANGNYLALEYTNVHDNAYYQSIMTQVKSVKGYDDEMPIAVVGKPGSDVTFTGKDMIGTTFNIAGKASTNITEYSSWNIMTKVLGFDPALRNSDEDEEYFRTNDEVINMPCYPADGSIRVIDGTVVIKFDDN